MKYCTFAHNVRLVIGCSALKGSAVVVVVVVVVVDEAFTHLHFFTFSSVRCLSAYLQTPEPFIPQPLTPILLFLKNNFQLHSTTGDTHRSYHHFGAYRTECADET